ncbi:ribosomal protein L4 [Aulographum hederae CBS 113979]|uniref:Large ribosomal subunit protein uL4m n=1 Tax=Aulographum hederae CBS 113979 TaxID=1176131 RepID=A0A6G1H089_9PEZI|nr:ribosomal protein L4 [Aulographum hederae CBS 113979]
MASSKGISGPLKAVTSQSTRNGVYRAIRQQSAVLPQSRSLATSTDVSTSSPSLTTSASLAFPSLVQPMDPVFPLPSVPAHIKPQTVPITVHAFPSFEPLTYSVYPITHLHLPLRRDVLHRAVIYEMDAARQGTAATKHRSEVHGSHAKMRPQKGTGRARIGDRQNPMLRGGGRAFDKKARDFSTQLPKKFYDLAWRTALSYRFRRGELLLVEDGKDLGQANPWLLREVLSQNSLGRGHGRCLFVSSSEKQDQNLFSAFAEATECGSAVEVEKVGVKKLLSLGAVVMRKSALDWMLRRHQSDLVRRAQTYKNKVAGEIETKARILDAMSAHETGEQSYYEMDEVDAGLDEVDVEKLSLEDELDVEDGKESVVTR